MAARLQSSCRSANSVASTSKDPPFSPSTLLPRSSSTAPSNNSCVLTPPQIEQDCHEVLNMSDSQGDKDRTASPTSKKQKTHPKRRFQDMWAAKFPWCEQQVAGAGEFDVVRCKICSKVNGADKILAAKDDNLAKHQGWKKALRDLRNGTKKDTYYWDKNSKHCHAERIYAGMTIDNIATLVANGIQKRKEIQFVVIFHLLRFGRPMVEYE